MNWKTILAALSLSLLAAAPVASQGAAPVFEDTPENRAIVEQGWEEYQRINAEHGHFIEVNGIRMHYLEWGNGEGVPLIWSHGYSSTSFELAEVAPGLVEAGYHVYSIDYRGHGQTRVDSYNFSLSHIADDIVAMMDALGIERAVIGGLSLGGGVTTAFYDHYPDRALALALEDGGADPVQARTELVYPLMKTIVEQQPRHADLVFDDRFAAFQALAGMYLPGWGGELPPGVAPMFQSWIVERDDGTFVPHYNGPKLFGEGLATVDPARSHELPLLHQSWRRTLPAITYRNLNVPMLIIDPTGDAFDASAEFEQLRAMHPELIRVQAYPDTPHAAHPMRPAWFVRDMAELLERLDTTAGV